MALFGLVGFPLGHSRSADYFNRRFVEEGHSDHEYQLFPLPSALEIPNLIHRHPDLAGFNVTIPYKESVMDLLDEKDALTAAIGSTNLVMIRRNGGTVSLRGFNTDAPAFASTLPTPVPHAAALVLGTGGASRAVTRVLKEAGLNVLLVSRRGGRPGIISYRDLSNEPSILQSYTMVVNTTPLGMFPDIHSCPDFPYGHLSPGHLLYDLVYNPAMTLFLRKGAAQGAQIQTGEEMFIRQASLSYQIFTGRLP